MFTPITDPITAVPAMHLQAKAWRVDLAEARTARKVAAESDATLDIWIVEAPWAHPAWHSYGIVLIHLRPMPDNRPTKIYLAGATHEMWVYALDPREDRNVMLRTGGLAWLQPSNFAAQFIEPSDEAAQARIEKAVHRICEGKLSPDTDYIRHWMHLFGDHMIKDKARAGETRVIFEKPDGSADALVIPPRRGPQDLN